MSESRPVWESRGESSGAGAGLFRRGTELCHAPRPVRQTAGGVSTGPVRKLAEMATEITNAQLLALWLAQLKDAGQ